VNSLPKTVTRQRRDCDLNPDPSASESSTLTTRLPSQPLVIIALQISERFRLQPNLYTCIIDNQYRTVGLLIRLADGTAAIPCLRLVCVCVGQMHDALTETCHLQSTNDRLRLRSPRSCQNIGRRDSSISGDHWRLFAPPHVTRKLRIFSPSDAKCTVVFFWTFSRLLEFFATFAGLTYWLSRYVASQPQSPSFQHFV